MRTDGRTQMTKVTGAFRNSENVTNKTGKSVKKKKKILNVS
jgi:hypothetical protein